MTFGDLDEGLRSQVEQVAFDAGCLWIEEFREERVRDPEPEECAEAALAANELIREVSRLLLRHSVEPTEPLMQSVRDAIRTQFVDALE